MIELTRLLQLTDPSAVLSDTQQQQSGSGSDSSSAVLCSLYEFWYTRSLLILLSSHCDEDKKRSMLRRLAEYNRTPGLLQLATDVNMLYSDQVGCHFQCGRSHGEDLYYKLVAILFGYC